MPKKKKNKRNAKRLPPLAFDSSGSAEAVFIGLPVEIGIHWADCGLRQHQLVCPERIGLDSKKCKFCESNIEELDDFLEGIVTPGPPITVKGLALCWDIVREKWSFLMTYYEFFREVVRDVDDGGGLKEFQDGNGPRFILQRTGRRMEVHRDFDSWGALDEVPDIPLAPSMNDVLVHLERKSAWVKYGTVSEVTRAHPKLSMVPEIDSFKMMGIKPHPSFSDYQGPPPIGRRAVAKETEDENEDITYEDSRGHRDRWDDVK